MTDHQRADSVSHVPDGWTPHLAAFARESVQFAYTKRIVFTRDWKYIFNGFDRDELYGLRAYPHEMVNLAARVEHREIVRQLCRRMWQFARAQQDDLLSNYFTVALAPFGPAEAFRSD